MHPGCNRTHLSPYVYLPWHTYHGYAYQVRLAELLSQLLATRGGTWEELWRVHDAALAELVLQVGVPCAGRGYLLWLYLLWPNLLGGCALRRARRVAAAHP
jgi:hypothetical protein